MESAKNVDTEVA